MIFADENIPIQIIDALKFSDIETFSIFEQAAKSNVNSFS